MLKQNEKFHKPTVLLVEDDADQRLIYQTMLERAGYDCIGAASGFSGLEVLRDVHVDLVVCDVLMPGMDGKEFIKRARQSKRGLSQLPVVSFSAASPEIGPELVAAGANVFCSKQAPKQKLLGAVASLIESVSSQQSLLEEIKQRFDK